jgi:hypothetical protein
LKTGSAAAPRLGKSKGSGTLKRIILFALSTLLLAATLSAQSGNATVAGQITDASGAIIPEATVSVQNRDTNVIQSTKTNSEGRYSITGLIPGIYKLYAESSGFKKTEQPAFQLQVGDRVALDLILQIGATNESVTVTSEVPLLRTDDAQAGLVIDNRRIMELPQYDRNPLAFAQLAPNVNGSSGQGNYGSDFRINGGRTNQTEYILDGQPVTTGYLHNVPPSVPSKEAIAEFKVMTNGLSAEYGRLSGGAVILATRSGTNEFHGSGYEFFKNDKLNANDWNSNRFGSVKGVFHDNVFGFTLGGPISIPKVYKGRDKTFFFLNYEGARHVTGSNSELASVPTALERQGDFSQSLIDNGKPVQIYDYQTGSLVNGHVARSPFPGNKIPESRFDPLSKIYMGYYPNANQAPRPGSTSDYNYIFARNKPANNNRWTARLDQNWNSKHTTHFSIVQYDYMETTPRAFSQLEAVGVNSNESYTASVEHNWTLAPTMILNMRAGFVRVHSVSGSEVNADASGWNLPQNVINLLGVTKGRVPNISMPGINSLGGGSIDDIHDTGYNGSVSIQKMWGKHTLKVGYEYRMYFTNETTGGYFSMYPYREVTARSPDEATTSGSGFASFLVGRASGGDGQQLAGPASLQKYHGAYIQDDFKVTRKLTVNAGLRWDFEPPRTERYDRQIFWDTDYTWNVKPNANWSWGQVENTIGQTLAQPEWMTNGIHGRAAMMGTSEYPMRTLEQSKPLHFGPRLAAAYQVIPRTVIRASYGMLWLTKTGNWHLGSARWNAGYGDAARLSQGGTPDNGLTYPLSFSDPMPGGAGYVPFSRNNDALNRAVMGNWWLSQTKRFDSGYEHNVQFAVQRELGSGSNTWVVEVAYNGSMGRSLPTWIGNGEHVLPDAYHKIGPLGSKLLQPVANPFYGFVPAGSSRGGEVINLGAIYELNPLWQQISTTGDAEGTSNYNSGYVQIEHRFSRGFSFLANYTMGKLMEDTGGIDHSTVGSNRFYQAGLGRGDVYSLSNSDYRNKVVLNYVYELPFGHGRHFLGNPSAFSGKLLDKIAGGWMAAGYTTFRSGQYLRVTGSNSLWWNAGQASNGDSERPIYVSRELNLSGSGHSSLEGASSYQPYMDRNAFRLAQSTPNLLEIGDVGWVTPQLVGPSFSQWDFSLMKNFSLGKESRYLQLRFEAQNLFNHMNAGNPDGNITSRTFGMITSQNGVPRQAMIAAKFYF